jgi:hypothetical protein
VLADQADTLLRFGALVRLSGVGDRFELRQRKQAVALERNKRSVGYHGVSVRSSSQSQCGVRAAWCRIARLEWYQATESLFPEAINDFCNKSAIA